MHTTVCIKTFPPKENTQKEYLTKLMDPEGFSAHGYYYCDLSQKNFMWTVVNSVKIVLAYLTGLPQLSDINLVAHIFTISNSLQGGLNEVASY